jgi:predicted GNAT superfamily acetyltransferase
LSFAVRTPDFELRSLEKPEDFAAAVTLQFEVWGEAFTDLVPAALLRVVGYVGGVAAGAFTEDGELAGLVFGVSGIRDGKLSHWSDTLAVRAEYRDRGLGESLKRFQRELLLPLGIERMYWTFDPLESRNAHLNFNRLGATSCDYVRDHYGATGSPLHQDIGTDRLIVQWELAARSVVALMEGGAAPAPCGAEGAPLVNAVREGAAGPESGVPDLQIDAPSVRVAIPADIQDLKAKAPECAREWRRVTRLTFEAYFARGYVARALVRRGAWSEYLLEHGARER